VQGSKREKEKERNKEEIHHSVLLLALCCALAAVAGRDPPLQRLINRVFFLFLSTSLT
jgi:hypothetical protein